MGCCALLPWSSAFWRRSALHVAGIKDPTWNPPARFDHAYSGKLTVHRLPQKQVAKVCTKVVGAFALNRHGCSTGDRAGRCTVWIVDRTYMRATPLSVLRHEIGHCNGWPADHPN
jgi:hypothetical protein